MGPGSCRMNDLVVVQSTQGVCAYLEKCFGEEGKKRGVVIGYDHRGRNGCNSRSFAQKAAAVFRHKGFEVYLFEDIVATPLVPFVLEAKKCCAGIMITASHNPADDNGYKLYWENAAQIIPPHDSHIAELIEECLEPWSETYGKGAEGVNTVKLDGDLVNAYFKKVSALCRFGSDNALLGRDYPITYTAMHGVGTPFVKRSFEAFQHGQASLLVVDEQCSPDPNFPTVAFPNPEEGKGALKLAFAKAESCNSRLVLANDPDADRLAVAERKADGAWHMFSGNDIGALLGHWAWRMWKLRNPQADASRVCMIASTVSSKFLASVARKEGFKFYETLTGFKWMGSKSYELQKQGFEVLFTYEEAIGFCYGDVVKDKDGVCAAAVFAEMAKQLQKEGKSCLQHLEHLYDTYGHVLQLNSYVKSPDPALTRKIFAKQRGEPDSQGKYKYAAKVDAFAVTGVRDLTVGYDTRQPDGKPELPLNLGGEMITYYFDEIEAMVTLRSSGTEPKIKWYSEMRSAADAKEASMAKLAAMVKAAVLDLLDPYSNGLEVRPDDVDLLGKAA
eukprot:TRINITY_DN6291_c0_g1_i1.p1 TRINITY_DN6291_c0_g1~~TRINITY_DN6291_c0_g1_i1.p1  ORF type:complete len:657 (-),score=170.73 TRINITY_DN6291_c0_g1_i1:210-1886(-)